MASLSDGLKLILADRITDKLAKRYHATDENWMLIEAALQKLTTKELRVIDFAVSQPKDSAR